MKKIAVTSGLLVLSFGTACGSGLNDALFFAFQGGSRTFLDVLVADFYSDLPNLFTLPPASGEPDDGEDDGGGGDVDEGDGGEDGGDDAGDGAGLVGDAVTGLALYGTNGCGICHCDDGAGECLPGSPNLQGSTVEENREALLGDSAHVGGKVPDLTEQDLADLVAFLADVGGGGDDGGDNGNGGGGPTGDAQAGQAFFTANACSACHCVDGAGGCAASAPRVIGAVPDTIRETLAGESTHTGGKFNDITDQEIADLAAFLAQ